MIRMNNKMISIVVLLFCMVYISESIVIGTQNIYIGGTKLRDNGRTAYDNLKDIATFINKYNIDIVALQEVDVNTGRAGFVIDDPQQIDDYLYSNHGRSYMNEFFGVLNLGSGKYGNAIIYENKFSKIEHKTTIFNSKYIEPRGAIAILLEYNSYKLWFVSTHFTYSVDIAKKQAKELVSFVSSFTYPTIICGDFNLDSKNGDIKSYLNGVFTGYTDINTGNNGGTYPQYTSDGGKIDYCWYKHVGNKNQFSIGNVQYIQPKNSNGQYYTDHWGLIFSVSFGSNNNNNKYGPVTSAVGRCLDIHEPELYEDGGRVQIWECNGYKQQSWFYDSSSGALINEGGKCLDVDYSDYVNNIDGGLVQIWKCNGWDNQKWDIVGNYIKSKNGKCLDIEASEQNENGGKVQVYSCGGADNQRWIISQ